MIYRISRSTYSCKHTGEHLIFIFFIYLSQLRLPRVSQSSCISVIENAFTTTADSMYMCTYEVTELCSTKVYIPVKFSFPIEYASRKVPLLLQCHTSCVAGWSVEPLGLLFGFTCIFILLYYTQWQIQKFRKALAHKVHPKVFGLQHPCTSGHMIMNALMTHVIIVATDL